MQECVVEGFSAILRGLDEDTQILDDFLLSAEVLEAQRPQGVLEILFFLPAFLSYVEFFHLLMGLIGLMGLMGQGAVLGLLHQLPFLVCLVAKAAEVQEAVNDDAPEFLVWLDMIELGIRLDGVETDVDVAAQSAILAVVEADVVGVIATFMVL